MTRDILDEAEEQYRMWHQKHPDGITKKTVQFPEEVYAIGTAREILYASDKWEKNGEFFDYHHCFDTRPQVFTLGGDGRARDVGSLLGVRDVNHGYIAMPELAEVKEFTFNDGERDHTLRFGKPRPLMSCSKDRRTLVIFAGPKLGGPYFVRSPERRSNPSSTRGVMIVTERGIVG